MTYTTESARQFTPARSAQDPYLCWCTSPGRTTKASLYVAALRSLPTSVYLHARMSERSVE